MKKLQMILAILVVVVVIPGFAFSKYSKGKQGPPSFAKSADIMKFRGPEAKQHVGKQVDIDGFYYDGSIPMIIDDIQRVFADKPIPKDSYVPIAGKLKGAKNGDRIKLKKVKLDRPSARDAANLRKEPTILRVGADATFTTLQTSTRIVYRTLPLIKILPGVVQLPRKYAVLISGGYNAANNHLRYFNDLKTMYAILRNKGYPAANIYVIYADGVSRNAAQLPVNYSATAANISTVFNALATKMKSSDTLYIMTNDHGGSGGTLCLWNSTSISAASFANQVNKIQNYDKIIVQMKQCYSGAMIPYLTRARRTVMSSCSATQYSYGHPSNQFGYFTYFYFAALTGSKPDGSGAVNADSNHDGKISITEAYNFARANTTTVEIPHFEDNGVAPAHAGSMPAGGDGTRSMNIFL